MSETKLDLDIHTPWYLDKSFLVTLLVPVILIVNKKIGLALDASDVAGLIAAIVGFIVSSKAKQAWAMGKKLENPEPQPPPTTAAEAARALDAIPTKL